MAKTKASRDLTLSDKLSRLTFQQASKLLEPNGGELIMRGGAMTIDINEQVTFNSDSLVVRFGDLTKTVVTVDLEEGDNRRIRWHSTTSTVVDEYVGAVFSMILEDKVTLGLAEPPKEQEPIESLSEQELVEVAINERKQRAEQEKMRLHAFDKEHPWTDYTITSASSGKTYQLTLRGLERGKSFCTCPDFRKNTLGTCKHLLYAQERIKKRFSAKKRAIPFELARIEVRMDYTTQPVLRLEVPADLDTESQKLLAPWLDCEIGETNDSVVTFVQTLTKLQRSHDDLFIHPDAEEFIQHRLFQNRMQRMVAEIRRDPANSPLRTDLLKVELLPYQVDGIAFLAGAGRAILADEMGLGKTIQAIGAVELLHAEAQVNKVLIVCPASLKAQWKNEIERFSGRSCQLVIGTIKERPEQYRNDAMFTICNYEQVLRDINSIESSKWDLIILDEGQRIKNWEAKTSRMVKRLRSQFAFVLSGTPLENRLDDLYSVVEFIDDSRLAPAFRFFNRHRVVNEKGKVLGYKNLDQLRESIAPVLLRRTRDMVLTELPPRTTEVIRVQPTEAQALTHAGHMQTVSQIASKKYLTEMDLLRLQRALLMCRLVANSTFLVDKISPGSSSKLDRLDELLEELAAEQDRKVVLFSEWTRMLDLIEPMLTEHGFDYVRLDGSVTQKKRQTIVNRFQKDPKCQFIIMTNAGSTGLNLQAANTVINIDLPWNPAVLEQRIGRAHRMGQKRPVHIYILITEETLEENLLTTLTNKSELSMAALDMESEASEVDFYSGIEELKRRLEVLLGAEPEAAQELPSESNTVTVTTAERRERVAAAGGQLLGAAFDFLGELVTDRVPQQIDPNLSSAVRDSLLDCIEQDENGATKFTISLPDNGAVERLAETLSKIIAIGGAGSNPPG